MRLTGKIALITGGSSGIGQETAEMFAREGATVVVASGSDVSKAELVTDRIVAAGGKAVPIKIDVRSPSEINLAIRDIVKQLGTIDILINSAGVYIPTPLGKTSEADFDQVVNTNLKGTFFTIQAVAEVMKINRSGRIINIASAAAFRGSATYPLYAVVKAGVVMLTRSLALDLAPHGVSINAIAPGNTATPLNENDRASEEIMAAKRLVTPSRRVYSPAQEMAEAILFLADGRVNCAHGSTLLLDEGLTA